MERSHFLQHPWLLAELSLVGKGELRASPWPTITLLLVSHLSAVHWANTFHELVHLIYSNLSHEVEYVITTISHTGKLRQEMSNYYTSHRMEIQTQTGAASGQNH